MAAKPAALIVGAGSGLSASIGRLLAHNGYAVALAARSADKLRALAGGIDATVHTCDAAEPAAVAALFDAVCAAHGVPEVVVYNASGRARGPIAELDPAAVRQAIAVAAFGGFLVGQKAAQLMLPDAQATGGRNTTGPDATGPDATGHDATGHEARARGTILFTGASASVKGYAQSAPFAMGKFALRGLAQSMARELAPRGIHVAHVVIDGVIRAATPPDPAAAPDSLLDPDAIAQTYWHLITQPRSAWSWEIEVRPWVERF